MGHKPVIYVSRISNLSDARYCAGMGVDMLGFVVDPSDADYVSPERYQELVGWIVGPARVLEIKSPVDIKGISEAYKPELIHTNLSLATKNIFGEVPLMIEVEYSEYSKVLAQINSVKNVHYVIINGINESVGAIPSAGYDILVSLETPTRSALKLLEKSRATGLALRGAPETAPGLKDYDHLSKILEEFDRP
jgi:phosphoribosylanthranilate isomerase